MLKEIDLVVSDYEDDLEDPSKLREMGLDSFGDYFDLEEWETARLAGCYIPDDGSGFWVVDGTITNDDAFGPKPEGATGVAWYNK